MGRLAGGIAGGVLSEGVRQFAQGKRPSMRDVMLTPGNVGRVANQLSQLRGAAMKVGQLISMDSGQILPAELSELLARLRSQADAMPTPQLRQVLVEAWGNDWQSQFAEFDFRPMASASIGQVHRAVTHDGQWLAIKVQYPGIANSIDSDIDNVAYLLRMARLLPEGLDIAPLLAEAKQQLHVETDYLQEAAAMQSYARYLYAEQKSGDRLVLPTVHEELTSRSVLAMNYCAGIPVDQLAQHAGSVRNWVTEQLLILLFRELFDFGLVQTDPNFANFLYDASEKQIVLLDFGATREYKDAVVDGYRHLLAASLTLDETEMLAAAKAIGYFDQSVTEAQRATVMELFAIATEPLRHEGVYDFSRSDLATRIREKGLQLSFEQEYWHSPPVDALFLHRKLAGLYLLATRLRAKVDLRPLRSWLHS